MATAGHVSTDVPMFRKHFAVLRFATPAHACLRAYCHQTCNCPRRLYQEHVSLCRAMPWALAAQSTAASAHLYRVTRAAKHLALICRTPLARSLIARLPQLANNNSFYASTQSLPLIHFDASHIHNQVLQASLPARFPKQISHVLAVRLQTCGITSHKTASSFIFVFS
jgi:hypothetical protein